MDFSRKIFVPLQISMGVQWTEVGRSKCEGTFVFYTRCENSEKLCYFEQIHHHQSVPDERIFQSNFNFRHFSPVNHNLISYSPVFVQNNNKSWIFILKSSRIRKGDNQTLFTSEKISKKINPSTSRFQCRMYLIYYTNSYPRPRVLS